MSWLVVVPVLAFVAILAVAVWIDRRSPAHPSQRTLPAEEPNAIEHRPEIPPPPDAEPTLVSVYAHARELPESWEDETIADSAADSLSRSHAGENGASSAPLKPQGVR